MRVVLADPGGQQARHACRLILAGSDELKQQVLPTLASGERWFAYALSEREAGSDTAAMKTRARADGDDWVLNGRSAGSPTAAWSTGTP